MVRYRIMKDTAYTDHTGTDVRLLELEANVTNEANRTVAIGFTILEWDLDGVVKVTKNDIVRKYYDVVGREKGGKPRKEEMKDKKKLIEVKDELM